MTLTLTYDLDVQIRPRFFFDLRNHQAESRYQRLLLSYPADSHTDTHLYQMHHMCRCALEVCGNGFQLSHSFLFPKWLSVFPFLPISKSFNPILKPAKHLFPCIPIIFPYRKLDIRIPSRFHSQLPYITNYSMWYNTIIHKLQDYYF